MSRTFKILISNWFRTRKFNRLFHAGMAVAKFYFSHHTVVTRWSLSTSNFYALIGQNLTGEFTRKIYAASWILFTLTAEADRVLCQLVMFLTVFFHWMHKMKFMQLLSRLFCNSWLVCLLRFLLTNAPLVKVIGNPISDGIVFKTEFTHLPLLKA